MYYAQIKHKNILLRPQLFENIRVKCNYPLNLSSEKMLKTVENEAKIPQIKERIKKPR